VDLHGSISTSYNRGTLRLRVQDAAAAYVGRIDSLINSV
jgi:hypothetical protein